ncbi:MAG: sugar-binding protein, partial [Bacteroidota bacterium]
YEISRTTDIRQDQMNMRLILAGRDAVAVDTIASLLMGWDPNSVKHLRYLNGDGLGNLDPACIAVAGKKVDEVRKFFAGVTPKAGGEKIADTVPPGLDVKRCSAAGDRLTLDLAADPETIKIEIELDGKAVGPAVIEDFARITADLGGLAPGAHTLAIQAYDRFLNRSERLLAVTKEADGSLRIEPVADTAYRAPLAKAAPAVDGKGTDKCWAAAPWREMKYLWLGTQPAPKDFRGRYKAVWTPDKLYFLVEITDDKLSDTHRDGLSDYYKDDTLEIFLDENRSGGDHTYNYNAFAYHIALDYQVVDLGPDRRPLYLTDHAEIKRTKRGNVYTWEIALEVYDDRFDDGFAKNKPIALYPGKRMGVAVAYCDNDGGADRESFMGSEDIPGADKNVAWQDADVFGPMVLEE